jgi:hypothetical protein
MGSFFIFFQKSFTFCETQADATGSLQAHFFIEFAFKVISFVSAPTCIDYTAYPYNSDYKVIYSWLRVESKILRVCSLSLLLKKAKQTTFDRTSSGYVNLENSP